ncbi:class I SAM-dependent methyltransferase [Ferrovibrio sp.]|uniref:class I SAM-dependent DNA methyltransferase n=1 Tax=Ferrovibrio sp. TaxID=1917215 RepID=UPI0035B2CBD9
MSEQLLDYQSLWSRLEEAYDRIAPIYNDHAESHRHAGAEALSAVLQQRFQFDLPGVFTAAFDLGCGTGHCGRALKQVAQKLAGVDLSAGMLRQASEQAAEYDEFIQGNGLAVLSERTGAFPLVAAINVMQLVEAPDMIFKTICDALPSGGVLIFNADVNVESVDNVREWRSGHYRFSPNYIAARLRAAGLALLYCHFYDDRLIDLPGGERQPVRSACYMVQKPN